MNIIDEMANEALSDKYFLKLFQTVEMQLWESIIPTNSTHNLKLSEKEYCDILTFADILSLSSNSEHKNIALKILSCLKINYTKDTKYRYYAKGIMVRLGNFPGYNLLISEYQDADILPLDISIEKEFKEIINKDDNSNKIFTDAQYAVFNELLDKNHFSFSGPTSFGKSFILTAFIKNLIENNRRGLNIVFLVPTRALVSQTLKKFKDLMDNTPGYYLSSNPDIPAIMRNQDAHYIFVFTPERLLHFFSITSNPPIEYVFVDEAQKILAEDTRSVIYYHAISLAERKSCKLFFSSPNIRNVDIFLKLFNKSSDETMSITESPVCQTRIFIDMLSNDITFFSDTGTTVKGKLKCENLLSTLILTISQNVNELHPKSLIYCNTIDDTINCALQMVSDPNFTPVNSQLLDSAADEIAKFIHKDYYLVNLIRKGIGFHFGKLPQKIRNIVEKLYEEGVIHYLFCTSTLLEGVNLPAQNIFILNNQIGNINMKSIDFWNLAGRAGRLTKELCGNVICIRWIDKRGRWDTDSSIDMIKTKQIEPITTDLLTGKGNFYKNILNATQGHPFTKKNITEPQRRLYNGFSNVILSHFFSDHPSLLRTKLQKSEPNSTKILTKIESNLQIPVNIISRFPLIKVQYQNEIWNMQQLLTPPLESPTFENCLKLLNLLYDIYHWDIEESKGNHPMLPKGNKKTLVHYANLLSDWMNGNSLNEIIRKAIYRKRGKRLSVGYSEGGIKELIPFDDTNPVHINIIINDTIREIDSVIRFTLKNYFENYYCIIKSRSEVDICSQDWSLYIEHGTTRLELIEIQKLGIPRHLSKLFYDDFGKYCRFDLSSELIDVDIESIKNDLRIGSKSEYQELLEILAENAL